MLFIRSKIIKLTHMDCLHHVVCKKYDIFWRLLYFSSITCFYLENCGAVVIWRMSLRYSVLIYYAITISHIYIGYSFCNFCFVDLSLINFLLMISVCTSRFFIAFCWIICSCCIIGFFTFIFYITVSYIVRTKQFGGL